MDNNIENIKENISKSKDEILNSYKDFIVTYEDTRELYEEIVGAIPDIIVCSGVYAKNESATSTKWVLVRIDGVTMYQSEKYKAGETCTIDLRRQNRVEGVQFKLKANVIGGDDSESTMILQYDPNAEFLKFELRGSIFKTNLIFTGPAPAPVI